MKDIKPRHRKAAMAAIKSGFVERMTRHTGLFYHRSDQTLVVTFDNMKSRETPSPAYPWGYEFLAKHNYSHLGIVMRRRNDWFRHSDLARFFDRLREEGFFKKFENVVFYGSSMGGYGALAYASASPGARVVAFSPQTSLDPKHAPFETRYRNGFARGDWSGPYLDGAEEAQTASQVTIFYDPYERIDRLHVERFGKNVALNQMKMPFSGHNTMRLLYMQKTLPEICVAAIEGRLTPKEFDLTLRKSRGIQTVARTSLNRAVQMGHPRLVLSALTKLEKTKPDWKFPKLRRDAQEAISQSGPQRD